MDHTFTEQLDNELSRLDRVRNETEYQALESEYFKITKLIREIPLK